ncbi:SRPBCC family protein [Corallococcus aberystwythensis]|uniref:SRPBCC domain-containing protein n=1 Tax=Corallococcus aberystwythensis TaxID=2316722 RepID=A0A3A8PW87_9BACT|nr:SRPBCC domain-containing protein [Corallococcus aberystwythensis]RKH60727.1 SRPBCC domain-containing protein [Corallococcus aberystwythensis]
MSELKLEWKLPAPPDAVFPAFAQPALIRRWFGAPPGCHRTHAPDPGALGQPYRVGLRDAAGRVFSQVGCIVEVDPGRFLALEMDWEGGPVPPGRTRAELTFHAGEGGTRLELRQGPFADDAARDAHLAYWEACLGRLERVVAGEAVPCFEEFWEESRGYVGPLAVAAYAVLAGLREAGAAKEAVAQVEDLLYTHLPRLREDTADVLGAVLQSRVEGGAS